MKIEIVFPVFANSTIWKSGRIAAGPSRIPADDLKKKTLDGKAGLRPHINPLPTDVDYSRHSVLLFTHGNPVVNRKICL